MFSIIFPGQGSQIVGMASELYKNFNYVRDYFKNSDEILKKNISNIILNGPKEELDQTKNTQPAIFLVSYSIFKVLEKETTFKINNAKFFAGHSLGEYSALCCAGSLNFEQTIYLLKERGEAMQNALPLGEGGMIAILGVDIETIKEMNEIKDTNVDCYIANDNSNGQIVISGKKDVLNKFGFELTKNKIKYVNLTVSAPFHCPLMKVATEKMKDKIYETKFKDPKIDIISNVTAKPVNKSDDIKKLLVEQIEKPVRWRESINNMLGFGVNHFIEIGPGKVLSGLVKRIDRKVKINNVNNLSDAKLLNNDRS